MPPPLPGVVHTVPPTESSPTLVLVPIRIGLNYVPPYAMYTLADCMQSSWFCGFFGGTPRHSLFVVGLEPQEDTTSLKKTLQRFVGLGGRVEYPWRFVVLDPHYTKPYPMSGYDEPMERPPSQFVESLYPPCFSKRETMNPDSLDPSLALGFYLPHGLRDFEEWKASMELIGKNTDSKSKMWALMARKEEKERKKGAFEALAEQYRMFSKSTGTAKSTSLEGQDKPENRIRQNSSADKISTDDSGQSGHVNAASTSDSVWYGLEDDMYDITDSTGDPVHAPADTNSRTKDSSSVLSRTASYSSFLTSSFSSIYRKSSTPASDSVHRSSNGSESTCGTQASFVTHNSERKASSQSSESIHNEAGEDERGEGMTRNMDKACPQLLDPDSYEDQQELETEAYNHGFGFRLFTFVKLRPGADDFEAFEMSEPARLTGELQDGIKCSEGANADREPYTVLSDEEIWDDSDYSLEVRKATVHPGSCTSPTEMEPAHAVSPGIQVQDNVLLHLEGSGNDYAVPVPLPSPRGKRMQGATKTNSSKGSRGSAQSEVSSQSRSAEALSLIQGSEDSIISSPYSQSSSSTSSRPKKSFQLKREHKSGKFSQSTSPLPIEAGGLSLSIDSLMSFKPRSDSYDLVEFSPAFSARTMPSMTSSIPSALGISFQDVSEMPSNQSAQSETLTGNWLVEPKLHSSSTAPVEESRSVPIIPDYSLPPQDLVSGFVSVSRDPFNTVRAIDTYSLVQVCDADSPALSEKDYDDLGNQEDRQSALHPNACPGRVTKPTNANNSSKFTANSADFDSAKPHLCSSTHCTSPASSHSTSTITSEKACVRERSLESTHQNMERGSWGSSRASYTLSRSSASSKRRLKRSIRNPLFDLAQDASHSSHFSSEAPSGRTASSPLASMASQNSLEHQASNNPQHYGSANSSRSTGRSNRASYESWDEKQHSGAPKPSILLAIQTPLPASASVTSSNYSSSSSASQSSKVPPSPPSPEPIPYTSLLTKYPNHSLLQEALTTNKEEQANGNQTTMEPGTGILSSLWKSFKNAPGVQYFSSKD